MDYRFCALLAKEIKSHQNVNILIQTHDVVNVFTYYYDPQIFESKNRMSPELLSQKRIYYVNKPEEIKNVKFKEKLPILFFQSYVKPKDQLKVVDYLKQEDYKLVFHTGQIEGVQLMYLIQ